AAGEGAGPARRQARQRAVRGPRAAGGHRESALRPPGSHRSSGQAEGDPLPPRRLRAMRDVPWNVLARLARGGLQEDIGPGDLPPRALVPEGARARGEIAAQQPLVAAGLEAARLSFLWLDPGARFPVAAGHGDLIEAGDPVLVIEGTARALL